MYLLMAVYSRLGGHMVAHMCPLVGVVPHAVETWMQTTHHFGPWQWGCSFLFATCLRQRLVHEVIWWI